MLRCVLTAMVISTHFQGDAIIPHEYAIYLLRPFHVTTFMFLSFFLCGHYFLEPSVKKVRVRVTRIGIPLCFWSAIGLFVALIGNVFATSQFVEGISLEMLLWQIFTAHTEINGVLWFLMVTIWISAFFWLIKLFLKNKTFIITLILISILCLLMQYSGINYSMFGDLPFELRYPLGRTIEMIPCASFGVLFSLLLPYLKNLSNKKKSLIFATSLIIFVAIFLIKKKLIQVSIENFGYSGLYLLIMSIILVFGAYTCPINMITNKFFVNAISLLTSFTMGIYCMHLLVGRIVVDIMIRIGIEPKTFILMLIIYIVCYGVAFGINAIPSKYTKSLVN